MDQLFAMTYLYLAPSIHVTKVLALDQFFAMVLVNLPNFWDDVSSQAALKLQQHSIAIDNCNHLGHSIGLDLDAILSYLQLF